VLTCPHCGGPLPAQSSQPGAGAPPPPGVRSEPLPELELARPPRSTAPPPEPEPPPPLELAEAPLPTGLPSWRKGLVRVSDGLLVLVGVLSCVQVALPRSFPPLSTWIGALIGGGGSSVDTAWLLLATLPWLLLAAAVNLLADRCQLATGEPFPMDRLTLSTGLLTPVYVVFGFPHALRAFAALAAERSPAAAVALRRWGSAAGWLMVPHALLVAVWAIPLAGPWGVAAGAAGALSLATLLGACAQLRQVTRMVELAGKVSALPAARSKGALPVRPPGHRFAPLAAATLGLLALPLALHVPPLEDRESCPLGARERETAQPNHVTEWLCMRGAKQHGHRVLRGAGAVLLSSWTYVNGHREGPLQEWSESGQLRKIQTWKNDIPDGRWATYSDRGLPLLSQEFSAGVLQGKSIRYGDEGRVLEETEYRAGLREGRSSEYWPDGGVRSQGAYRQNKKDGPWDEWNAAGVHTRHVVYDLGQEREVQTFEHERAVQAILAKAQVDAERDAARPPLTDNPRDLFTESKLRAGHSIEWWENRLNDLRRRDPKPGEELLYELSLRRAQENGLEVVQVPGGVKVTMARPASPDGGAPR